MFEDEIRLTKLAIENGDLPPCKEEELEQSFKTSYESPYMFIKCDANSIFWGALVQYLGDSSITFAKEIFWYSEKPSSNSYKMFREFEQWAEEQGASEIFMESLGHSPQLDSIYERKGYTKGSTVFRKKL